MTPEMAARHSPHRLVDAIPRRCSSSTATRTTGCRSARRCGCGGTSSRPGTADRAEIPHRFLYFPDENHWVLNPQHAMLWYETVLAFLDHHVRGRDWVVPELLR